MPKKLFQPGNPGKPIGAISRYTRFKDFMFNNFHENEKIVKETLVAMYANKDDCVTLLRYLYDLSPKEIAPSENLEKDIDITNIVNNINTKPISINDRPAGLRIS
jgi:hypothetical protein